VTFAWLALALALPACGDDAPAKDEPAKVEKKKKELPKREEPEDLLPEKKLDLSGPKAPEASTVIFAVNGALVPLACFNKESNKVEGGHKCADMVKDGEELYVYAEHTKDIDIIGGPKNSLCEVSDNPTSRSAKSVDAGAAYDFAVWPKSAHDLVKATGSKTRAERTLQFDGDEEKALLDAIHKLRPKAKKGEFRPEQKAELDLEGDGKMEVFYSIVIAHPTDPDQNLFAGVLMAPGGDMAALTLIDESRRQADIVTLSGAVDLNGDGTFHPWTTLTFDGGSGDRIVELQGGKPKPLSKWSCGV
jgi:hypothetical protein